MTNTDYLSTSVEAARLRSAEAQFEPVSEPVIFTVKPFTGSFWVSVLHPYSLPVFSRFSRVAEAFGFSHIQSVYRCTEQTQYIITPLPGATLGGIEQELERLLLPF